MANWLNTAFSEFDYALLQALHGFTVATGGVLTPLIRLLTAPGNGGLGFILLCLALLCFRKTRQCGAAMSASMAVGALITNIVLKPLVARPRPYTTEVLREWWLFVGGFAESDLSFPSGHATMAAAVMLALFLCTDKKYSWPALIYPLVMGFTRLYLMVHYPTDVIAGLLAGTLGALCGVFLTRRAFAYLQARRERTWCRILLECDPVPRLWYRLFKGNRPDSDDTTDA